MGHRDVKRVPLDFDWPMSKVWQGYLTPDGLIGQDCRDCGGSGYSPWARHFRDQWYGKAPFHPFDTGSVPLTVETPEVRAFAERNVSHAPEFYGTSEAAVTREARRLVGLWNPQWCHHLAQQDVDALVAAGRLMDFTHTHGRGTGWVRRDPVPPITAATVNAWSIGGFGHDGINQHVAVEARCERLGVPTTCPTCQGHGSIETYAGQRADADAWEPFEPPTGEGWQLWETTSEGSPVSPVFATAETLADWCADNATWFGQMRATREEWLRSFLAGTTDVDSLLVVRSDA